MTDIPVDFDTPSGDASGLWSPSSSISDASDSTTKLRDTKEPPTLQLGQCALDMDAPETPPADLWNLVSPCSVSDPSEFNEEDESSLEEEKGPPFHHAGEDIHGEMQQEEVNKPSTRHSGEWEADPEPAEESLGHPDKTNSSPSPVVRSASKRLSFSPDCFERVYTYNEDESLCSFGTPPLDSTVSLGSKTQDRYQYETKQLSTPSDGPTDHEEDDATPECSQRPLLKRYTRVAKWTKTAQSYTGTASRTLQSAYVYAKSRAIERIPPKYQYTKRRPPSNRAMSEEDADLYESDFSSDDEDYRSNRKTITDSGLQEEVSQRRKSTVSSADFGLDRLRSNTSRRNSLLPTNFSSMYELKSFSMRRTSSSTTAASDASASPGAPTSRESGQREVVQELRVGASKAVGYLSAVKARATYLGKQREESSDEEDVTANTL